MVCYVQVGLMLDCSNPPGQRNNLLHQDILHTPSITVCPIDRVHFLLFGFDSVLTMEQPLRFGPRRSCNLPVQERILETWKVVDLLMIC